MPIEDEQARQAARARLQARQERGGRSGSSASERQRSSSQNQKSGSGGRSGSRRAESYRDADRRTARQGDSRQQARGSSRSPQRSSSRYPNPYDDRSASARRARNAQTQAASASDGRGSSILPDSIPPIFVVGLVVAIVAVFVFSVIMPNCSGRDSKTGARQSGSQAATIETDTKNPAEDFTLDTSKPQQAALAKMLGNEPATKLLGKALSDFDALWIAAHPDKYEFDGIELQYKAMKLAADEDEAIPFVRSYPSKYPTGGPSEDESLALPTDSPVDSVPNTNIPHLYQWDQRWANTGFAGTALGLSGSGPTCLAMVRAGLTGDSSMTPYDIAQAATDFRKTVVTNATTDPELDASQLDETETVGAILEKQGMKAEFLYDGAESLGLQCAEMYPTYENIRDALVQGQVIILDIEPGRFTTTDSYVVLTDMANNGQAIMNDPFSIQHSSQLWDIDELAAASTTMFVYTT